MKIIWGKKVHRLRMLPVTVKGNKSSVFIECLPVNAFVKRNKSTVSTINRLTGRTDGQTCRDPRTLGLEQMRKSKRIKRFETEVLGCLLFW